MNSVLALALVVGMGASDPATTAVEPSSSAERTVEAAVVERAAAPEVAPVLMQMEQPKHAEHQSEAAATPPRGSFWWTVGAIVVAGIILAVIL
jgi:hypothetical protein